LKVSNLYSDTISSSTAAGKKVKNENFRLKGNMNLKLRDFNRSK